nr:glycoside hydrolase family 9 protein [Micromonospora sp. KC207]
MALAFDFTGQQKYRSGAYAAYGYLFGRNPLNQSYVAGYGEEPVTGVARRAPAGGPRRDAAGGRSRRFRPAHREPGRPAPDPCRLS